VVKLDASSDFPASRWSRLAAYVALPHPWPILMVLLATAGFGLVVTRGSPEPGRFALMLLAMFGGQIAIGVHNEYVDRHDDARAQPWKPIARGLVSPRTALAIMAGGLLTLIVAGSLLGALSLLLAVAGTGCGLVYNQWLKRTWLSWLPYALALPLLPIWVAVVFDRFQAGLLLLYLLGFPLVVAVHLAQTLPDISGDRQLGHAGLAARLGRTTTRRLIWAGTIVVAVSVALGGHVLLGAWLPALTGAVAAGMVLLAGWVATRSFPDRDDRDLFRFVTLAALCLMIGWAVAIGF
jgi:4-hydroxybenzoate polyprenyltransferase